MPWNSKPDPLRGDTVSPPTVGCPSNRDGYLGKTDWTPRMEQRRCHTDAPKGVEFRSCARLGATKVFPWEDLRHHTGFSNERFVAENRAARAVGTHPRC